jgi:hypothetical protein
VKKNLFLPILIASALAAAAPAVDPGAEDLARGKTYVLEPAPNYPHCTEAGDAKQLTDGVRTEGYFWTQASTVGWSGISPVTVTIDLGRVEPIGGATFGTAAGVAGVTWPEAIGILASEDGKAWRLAGDLVALAVASSGPPPASRYALHTFRAPLASRGRFVKLAVSGGPYIFCDEIEVLRGPPSLLEGDPSAPFGADRYPTGKEIRDPAEFFAGTRVATALRRRLSADLAAVRGALDAAKLAADARRPLDGELAAIEKAIPAAEPGPMPDFRTVFPIGDLHRRTFAVQAAAWRAAGLRGLVVWAKDRWDPLSPTERPAPGGASLDVPMMRNEFRGAAFNLSNAGEAPARALLSIEGLPGGRSPAWVSVHEVPFTDTRSGVPVAAALPPARRDGDRWAVEVPSGLTVQVWLSFHTRGVPEGDHKGNVLIEGFPPVPLRVKVHPIDFPDRPALHLGGWDYTDRESCYEVTPENRGEFIRTLREHFVDTPWAQSAVMPAGKHDAEGKMTEPPADGEFREWIRRWPDARNYFVFSAVGESYAGIPMGTPPFRRAVGEWIRWWSARLLEWGIGPERLGLLLVDEPRAPEHDRVIIEWARAIREAEPRVMIWEDPIWTDPSKGAPEMFRLCHVLCPNLPMWLDGGPGFAAFYLKEKAEGRRLWLYSCSGPGKLLDPYAYHRLQAWFAWKHGAQGEGFWAFGDSNGASSWNEYLATVGAYTPLFLDRHTVTPGKHMEAVREGVEDFEYLRMLDARVREIEARGGKPEGLAEAKRLLAEGPDRVTAPMTSSRMGFWREAKDRSAADRVRGEVLEALARLPR